MKPLKEASIKNNWKSFTAYRERRLQGVLTGIKAIDTSLLGLGGITVIQGETGSFKSTLALQIAHHNLKLGTPCLMLDRENGEGRVRSRLLCQEHNVSETDIKCAPIEQIKKWAAPVVALPLYVYTESISDFDLVRARLEEMRALHPDSPSILLVDSLQAMSAVDDDQRVNLEKWMYFFDELKVQSDGQLTVIITSEKNRASYGTQNVGGAKGSNAVEYKAETLLDVRLDDAGNIRLKVAKNRDGNRNQEFELTRCFSERGNANSFTFHLKSVEELGL